jgi:hypothetical protein
LKENLLVKLQEMALEELTLKGQAGEAFIPVTLKISRVLEERQNPPAGTPSQMAQLNLQVEYNAWYYQVRDLETVAQIALDSTLESGMRAIPGTLTIVESQGAAIEKEIARWKVNATRKVTRVYPENQVLNIATGRSVAEAQNTLRNELGFTEMPQIEVFPSWWPWLPLLPFRIEVIAQ